MNDEQRYEGKLTYTPRSGHSLQGSYFKLTQILENNAQFNVGDLQSLTRQGQPQSLAAVQYTGVLTPNFSFVTRETCASRPCLCSHSCTQGAQRTVKTTTSYPCSWSRSRNSRAPGRGG